VILVLARKFSSARPGLDLVDGFNGQLFGIIAGESDTGRLVFKKCLLNSRGKVFKLWLRMMRFLSKRPQSSELRCALLLAAIWETAPVLKADSPSSQGLIWEAAPVLKTYPSSSPPDAEPNSPQEMNPGLVEPGLSQHAVPNPNPPAVGPDLDLETFYWQTHPFENSVLLAPILNLFSPDDPAAFRPVVSYAPPLGLWPRIYRPGLLESYAWAGLAQSFDSNVRLTSHGQFSDFYTTPRFGLEMQLGTPDSVYNERYDTIFAAHLVYEGYADLFYEHPDLSAYNQQLNFSSRIGRDRFTLRPFASFSDVTGSNLQLVELQNRAERIITTGGVVGEYGFTPVTSWRQTYSVFDFEHQDPAYINYTMWSTRQELTWLLPNNSLKAILWAGAQTPSPDAGFGGNEFLAGLGWQGEFNSRLHSRLWLGWGALQMDGNVPGRKDLSGLRYDGYTVFEYSQRMKFTLLYDRVYVFNEQTRNDNYVATITQLKTEIYLGSHWLVMPYLGCSVREFETSGRCDVEPRLEVEFAYVFGKEDDQIIDERGRSAGSRIFFKIGYDDSETIQGSGDSVAGFRTSTGLNWNF
jgi:hypothetical protein